MENGRTFRNYSPEEIDKFLESVIKQVDVMIKDNKVKNQLLKEKDEKIDELQKKLANTAHLQDKLAQYERMESTLNRAILMAQRTSDQIKSAAHKESEIIINDAKNNASRIVNESLLKAEKTEAEAEMLKRNITVFKRRLRGLLETQMELVEDIEKVEF